MVSRAYSIGIPAFHASMTASNGYSGSRAGPQSRASRYSKGTPAETLTAFKAVLHERTAPLSGEAMLGDTLVHAEDIRRSLGLTREYPLETLRELGDYYKDSSGLGVKKRIDGLHLMATDQKWDHGKGEIVQGPLLALIMTMTGRAEYLDDLAGDGLPEYRARLTK